MTVPFVGLEECARNLEKAGRDSWQEVKSAFWMEGTEIIREAMEIVPVDTGKLRSTIPIVSHLEETPTTATAIIGCGTDYGVYVHENLMARHAAPTRAKFLEIPIMHRAPDIPKNIVIRLTGSSNRYQPADVSEMLKI